MCVVLQFELVGEASFVYVIATCVLRHKTVTVSGVSARCCGNTAPNTNTTASTSASSAKLGASVQGTDSMIP